MVDQPPAWPPVRHPFQVSSMTLFLTLGAGWLINDPSPALRELMGNPLIYVWAWVLVLSGVCGIISAAYARRDEGLSLLTERLALVGICSYSIVYILALVVDKGLGVWVTEVLFGGFVVACTWRYAQVRKRIRWNKQSGRETSPRWRS